jgi:endonuclease/exonuclease/phosphatase family metal-dependent hydrolase
VGTDGRLDVPRVADVIVALRADIVCLQELDVGRARTGGIDQAEAIAQLVKMRSRFHPAMYVREEQYGDAILTALPNRVVKAGALPTVNLPGLEPRGALWIDIEAPSPVGGPPLQIINTHLGLVPREQRAQAAALLGPRVVRGARGARAAAGRGRHERAAGLVGLPGAAAAAARRAAARSTARGSSDLSQHLPMLRIDHVFASAGHPCPQGLGGGRSADPARRRTICRSSSTLT